MDPNLAAIKIGFNGELHRQRVHLDSFSLASLRQLFTQTFRLVPGTFVLQYLDADGDLLNVVSEAEFVEACRVLLGGRDESAGVRTLKFTAELRADADAEAAVSSSAPALPLAEAVDRLAVSLNHTLATLRSEDIQGLEDATEALNAAAVATQQTLERVQQAAPEVPLEQVLNETSDGLKSAARGISTFAQRIVSSFIPEKRSGAAGSSPTPPTEEFKPAVLEYPAEQAPPAAPPAPVAVAAPEVVVPTPVTAVAAEEPSVNVAFTDAEAKWSEQLTVIRSILPHVNTELAVSVLERTDGDIEVSVNHLMEQGETV